MSSKHRTTISIYEQVDKKIRLIAAEKEMPYNEVADMLIRLALEKEATNNEQKK